MFKDGKMIAPIVFFGIADEAFEHLMEFYSELFGWQILDDGQFNIPVVTTIPGTIRKYP